MDKDLDEAIRQSEKALVETSLQLSLETLTAKLEELRRALEKETKAGQIRKLALAMQACVKAIKECC